MIGDILDIKGQTLETWAEHAISIAYDMDDDGPEILEVWVNGRIDILHALGDNEIEGLEQQIKDALAEELEDNEAAKIDYEYEQYKDRLLDKAGSVE